MAVQAVFFLVSIAEIRGFSHHLRIFTGVPSGFHPHIFTSLLHYGTSTVHPPEAGVVGQTGLLNFFA